MAALPAFSSMVNSIQIYFLYRSSFQRSILTVTKLTILFFTLELLYIYIMI